MTNINSSELKKLGLFPERSILFSTKIETQESTRRINNFLNHLKGDEIFTKSFFDEMASLAHADRDLRDNNNRSNADIIYKVFYDWCKKHGQREAIHSLEKRGLVKIPSDDRKQFSGNFRL